MDHSKSAYYLEKNDRILINVNVSNDRKKTVNWFSKCELFQHTVRAEKKRQNFFEICQTVQPMSL